MVTTDQKHFFHELYASIEKKCSEEQLKKFAILGTDEERFKFVDNLVGVNHQFDALRFNSNGKCSKDALELKKEGNSAFQVKDYTTALEKYTKSQLVTPTENGEFVEWAIIIIYRS